MYLQGKWRRGRVHTASCRCYRLIDREYHNLMVRFPLLSPNHQHCSWQENFVIAIFYFLYSLLYSVFVFGIWSGFPPLPQPPTPAPNIATCKDILYLHSIIFCILLIVFVSPPLPQPPAPAPNIIARKFCILHSHCLIFGNLYFVFGQNPFPPNHPVQNIVCKETDSPEFYLLLLMSWRMSFVLFENLDLPAGGVGQLSTDLVAVVLLQVET